MPENLYILKKIHCIITFVTFYMKTFGEICLYDKKAQEVHTTKKKVGNH